MESTTYCEDCNCDPCECDDPLISIYASDALFILEALEGIQEDIMHKLNPMIMSVWPSGNTMMAQRDTQVSGVENFALRFFNSELDEVLEELRDQLAEEGIS